MSGDPRTIIVAGPNGAGKTTFALEYLRADPLPFLSADAVAADLAPDDPARARVEAGKVFLRRLGTYIEAEESFAVETTLAGLGFERLLDRMQPRYDTTLVFLFLDRPETCLARVRERVAKGGHHVPEADVVRRYYRSKRNFWNVYRFKANRWQLYFNATEGVEGVATGDSNGYSVSNDTLFQLFLSDLDDYAGS
ncbi:MAG: AAA family ATPase [Bacteroidota bacterium]